MTSILVLGFLIGIRHAFEPDHIAAVAALSTRTTSLRQSMMHGAAWGLGHTLTLFIICGLVISLQTTVSENLAHILLEGIVGIMLVLLGIDVLRRLIRDRIHFHVHHHDHGTNHFHAHSHKGEKAAVHNPDEHQHTHGKEFPVRYLLVGLMHGMAGHEAMIVLSVKAVD